VNVSPELNGSMFTDRQELHQHKLVSSDASEESFHGNSPDQLKSGVSPRQVLSRSECGPKSRSSPAAHILFPVVTFLSDPTSYGQKVTLS
jgi:hypothetical protein